jgi:hypothetical protein
MAALTRSNKPNLARIAFIKKRDEIIEELMPRRCMVVSTALFLAGVSIPMLMQVQLLPVNFLLSFVGYALTVTGGVMALILCGEI